MKKETSPARRRTDGAKQTPRQLRILCVDDDLSYLRYLNHVLTRAGFEVETASDGTSAIARVRTRDDVDLLLVDLAMPGLDGIETVQQIHRDNLLPGLYTILLTANDGSETKLRALDSGLDDFLTKMSSEEEIVAKLRSAARRVEMERRLQVRNEELQALALTDELTGIANRRALFRAAGECLTAGRTLSVVLFDLDRFKYINDTYGHLTGDRILADVGATLAKTTRVGDVIARYGGDEFVLLLPDADLAEARRTASRLANAVHHLRWTERDVVLTITMSWGAAQSLASTDTLLRLLTECDQKLYGRKAARVTLSGTVEVPSRT